MALDSIATGPAPKTSIFPILLVNFIGSLGYSIILPFMAVLVIKFGGNELVYGVLGATYSFFQLLGAPILGRWSDRIGRRKVLLISQAGTFLAWLVFLVALLLPQTTLLDVNSRVLGVFVLTLPLLMLFVARVLDGLTGGNISVANAYLADITTDDDRKANFGKMSAAGNMGFIIGPALAGVLGATVLGDILPVGVAMAVSLLAIAVIYYRLEESQRCVIDSNQEEHRTAGKVLGAEHKECYDLAGDKLTFAQVFRLPGVPFFLMNYFLIFLGFNFFYVAFPIYAIQVLEWTIFSLGIFYSVLGGIMVLFQGPVLTWLSGRYAESTLIVVGGILLTAGFLGFSSGREPVIFVSTLLFSSGNGILWPSFLSLLSQLGAKQQQGSIQGLASSTGSMASIIGLLAGGVLFGLLGAKVFLLSAATMILVVTGASRMPGKPLTTS